MALNGSIGWSSGGPYNTWGVLVTWSATQNIAGNYSDVTASVSIRSTNSGSWFQRDTDIWLSINGSSDHKVFGNLLLNPNSTAANVYTRTVRVPHDPGGGKIFALSASMSNANVGTVSVSGSGSLKPIARVSTLDWNTSDFPHTYGKSLRFTVNSGSSDFYHSMEVRTRGVLRGAPLVNARGGGVKTFTIPMDWLNAAGDTQLETCSFRLITHTKPGSYAADSLIGFNDYSGQISVPSNIVPTISSVTYADQNTDMKSLTGSDQILVQARSMPQMNVQASGAYSSLIKSFRFEIGGATYDRPGYLYTIDLGNLPNLSGNQKVKVTVTDTRGRTATMEDTLDIRQYALPTITNVNAGRKPGTPTIGLLTKTVRVSSIKNGTTEKNTYTVTIQTKKTTETAWQTINTENNTNQTNYEIKNCAIDSSYNIKIIVTDRIATISTETILQTDKVFMDKHRDEGLGILKYHETGKGALQVGGETWAEGYRDLSGRKLIDMFYPIGSIFQSVVATDPSTFMGGTWIRIGQGQVLVGVNESDSDFNAPGKVGGSKEQVLQAWIGAVDSDTGRIGYKATPPVTKTYDGALWIKGTSSWSGGIGEVNHNTVVTQSTGRQATTIQPYTTVYMWRRTA